MIYLGPLFVKLGADLDTFFDSLQELQRGYCYSHFVTKQNVGQ